MTPSLSSDEVARAIFEEWGRQRARYASLLSSLREKYAISTYQYLGPSIAHVPIGGPHQGYSFETCGSGFSRGDFIPTTRTDEGGEIHPITLSQAEKNAIGFVDEWDEAIRSCYAAVADVAESAGWRAEGGGRYVSTGSGVEIEIVDWCRAFGWIDSTGGSA